MPDKRLHRGPHPEDAESFSSCALPALRAALVDFSWLLSRDYAQPSAIKLVGDRYQLTARQRVAVLRCSCSDSALERRRAIEIPPGSLRGSALHLDGYNVLTTVEAALAGGVILEGRDGCYRGLASMHGNFKMVAETMPALQLTGETLHALGVRRARWLFDEPVSSSGRLATLVREIAVQEHWDWEVELVRDPDAILRDECTGIIASADSAILDGCQAWFNLARAVVSTRVSDAHRIALTAGSPL